MTGLTVGLCNPFRAFIAEHLGDDSVDRCDDCHG